VGLARAKASGQRLGRRRKRIGERDLQRVAGLSAREAAKVLAVPASKGPPREGSVVSESHLKPARIAQ
jgi:hypothetical protein